MIPGIPFPFRLLPLAAWMLAASLGQALGTSEEIRIPLAEQTIPEIGAEVRGLREDDRLPPTEPPQPPLGPVRPLTLAQAVALTLEQNPNIILAQQSVLIARGQLQQAAGPFDPTLTSSINASYQQDQTRQTSNNLMLAELLGENFNSTSTQNSTEEDINARLQLAKTFRNGITIAPRVLYSGTTQGQQGSTATEGEGLVGFTIRIPFLRGLGPNSVNTAAERAARINVDAMQRTAAFTVSQQVLNTITSYWNCLLAQESVRIARSNEISALRLLEITEALIKGYIQPDFSLIQSRANYEQYVSQRVVAEQQQSMASQELAVAIGLSPQQILKEPLVIENFPPPAGRKSLQADEIPALIDLALRERADLQAARLTEAVNVAELQGARNNALPQLDATVGGAALRTRDRESSSPDRSTQTGLGVSAGLSVELPLFNDAALGQVVQQQGQLDQARTQILLQESQIAGMVVTAAKAVINAARALEAAEAAVRDQIKSVEGQERLFSMGMSSLVEVITTQTNLADAELSLLQSKNNYATALAQIRYATGTLLTEEQGDSVAWVLSPLFTLPPGKTSP